MSFDNGLIRALVVIVMVAASLRLVFILVTPILPYLLVVLVVYALLEIRRWWRSRC